MSLELQQQLHPPLARPIKSQRGPALVTESRWGRKLWLHLGRTLFRSLPGNQAVVNLADLSTPDESQVRSCWVMSGILTDEIVASDLQEPGGDGDDSLRAALPDLRAFSCAAGRPLRHGGLHTNTLTTAPAILDLRLYTAIIHWHPDRTNSSVTFLRVEEKCVME